MIATVEFQLRSLLDYQASVRGEFSAQNHILYSLKWTSTNDSPAPPCSAIPSLTYKPSEVYKPSASPTFRYVYCSFVSLSFHRAIEATPRILNMHDRCLTLPKKLNAFLESYWITKVSLILRWCIKLKIQMNGTNVFVLLVYEQLPTVQYSFTITKCNSDLQTEVGNLCQSERWYIDVMFSTNLSSLLCSDVPSAMQSPKPSSSPSRSPEAVPSSRPRLVAWSLNDEQSSWYKF